jgi:arginine decarboxylase-like protein
LPFLPGAYREILGDQHNLFGDTNAVHVSLDGDGEINVDTAIKGTRSARCCTTCSARPTNCWR